MTENTEKRDKALDDLENFINQQLKKRGIALPKSEWLGVYNSWKDELTQMRRPYKYHKFVWNFLRIVLLMMLVPTAVMAGTVIVLAFFLHYVPLDWVHEYRNGMAGVSIMVISLLSFLLAKYAKMRRDKLVRFLSTIEEEKTVVEQISKLGLREKVDLFFNHMLYFRDPDIKNSHPEFEIVMFPHEASEPPSRIIVFIVFSFRYGNYRIDGANERKLRYCVRIAGK